MKSKLKRQLEDAWRTPFKNQYRKGLKREDFLIISSNCIAGTLLHDLGLPFNTPTINTTIYDFPQFCENLEENLKITPTLAEDQYKPYPIFQINGINIHAVHYKSGEEFLSAWERRTKRFFEKLEEGYEVLLIATDAQLREEGYKEAFQNLEGYRKVAFCKDKTDFKDFVYVPGYENETAAGDLTRYADKKGTRYFEKYFDCLKFINSD